LFKERSVRQLRTAKGRVTTMATTDVVVDHVDEHPVNPARREVACKNLMKARNLVLDDMR
jgi:hypothetical protein